MFRVGRVDFNDTGWQVTKAPPISSHEFSSHERSGTVTFVVSGSGKKGTCLVFSPQPNRTHPQPCRRAKVVLRMFAARKACYKCGNGVSAPFSIVLVRM